jgi:hypothetical protein
MLRSAIPTLTAVLVWVSAAEASHPVVIPPPVVPPHVLVEGTVRNLLTGRPIAGVRVLRAAPFRAFAAPSVALPPVYTDANGHYSMLIDVEQWRAVGAICAFRWPGHDDVRTATGHSLLIYAEIEKIERNLYLTIPRGTRSCIPLPELALPDLALSEGDPSGVLLLPPQPIEPPNILVEGHVRNRRTGRPVRHAVVTPAFPTGHPLIEFSDGFLPGPFAVTDRNGFFSLVVDQSEFFGIQASCSFGLRDDVTRTENETASLPRVAVESVRRDVYLDLPKRRRNCLPTFIATDAP